MFSTRLDTLLANNQQVLLGNGLKGIEKESLRISKNGLISQTPHPKVLGSALTHPYITTDYSEALLEFITPPFADIKESLAFLNNIHQFVYDNLTDQILLNTSMPCGIDGDDSIPIADYGSSNMGRMKHVYRHGLWHRYGRTMQSIAGIHFNYSVPEALWAALHANEKPEIPLQAFQNDAYYGLIRNFQRQGWLILYLFGASPAICKSFFKSRPSLMAEFEEYDSSTLYLPYATSLRMSDIGYKSKNQANLQIDYNTLDGYVESLGAAIATPYPEYEKIGVKVAGEYRQLNANLLQIENEFYSTIRPKQIINSGEKPTLALKRRGVRYVEIRSLDLDIFNPIGIEETTARFIEAWLLTCLLKESPQISEAEHQVNNANQLAVAHSGRKPGLELSRNHGNVLLQDWACEILSEMETICKVLDLSCDSPAYSEALAQQKARVQAPELTASARILAEMDQQEQEFSCFSLNKSSEHKNYFKQRKLEPLLAAQFQQMAEESLDKQLEIENMPQLPFDEFLNQYFSQK
ncbi:MAG: glutamate--cysteine ligase [Methylococcaceae bacterium]|jgi:glutamate--cysteine ligase